MKSQKKLLREKNNLFFKKDRGDGFSPMLEFLVAFFFFCVILLIIIKTAQGVQVYNKANAVIRNYIAGLEASGCLSEEEQNYLKFELESCGIKNVNVNVPSAPLENGDTATLVVTGNVTVPIKITKTVVVQNGISR